MLHTQICDILGIEYPIIAGGMMWFSTPEFAAAASNAGILGIITAARCSNKQELVEQIHKTRSLTNKPFGVNISMLPEVQPHEMTKQFFEAVAEEGVPVVETSGRDPGDLFEILKSANVKIIHKVPAVRHAIHAQKSGADIVTIVGTECGGHPGMDNIGTMVLVPRAVEEVTIPVIAGGGIADARGLVAALALGASGVVIGTRFMASQECMMHQNFKDWMIKATEKDTMLIQRSIKNQARVRRNADAETVLSLEESGNSTLQDLMPYISGKVGLQSIISGNMDKGTFPVGQSVGLVHEIKPLADIVQELVSGASEVMKYLNKIF